MAADMPLALSWRGYAPNHRLGQIGTDAPQRSQGAATISMATPTSENRIGTPWGGTRDDSEDGAENSPNDAES